MLLPRIGGLLLVASTANAFKESSPFLLLSSDPIPKDAPLQSAQVALSKDVEDRLVEMLSSCDNDIYIYEQEHVSADDLRQGAMPKLQSRIQGLDADKMIQIPEVMVMGELSAEAVDRRVAEACAAKGKYPTVDFGMMGGTRDYELERTLSLACVSPEYTRAECLESSDEALENKISKLFSRGPSSRPAVLIYITTPVSSSPQDMGDTYLYEMDDPYPSALHTDLKRDLHEIRKRQSDNSTNMQDGLGLFEKYQFFTPALFMGLTVSVFLIGILYVGVSAIAGLEVSYMAFNKEMGPQAQKGKQQ